jgi:hypothetical protein
MEKVSMVLEENRNGIGVRAIQRAVEEATGRTLSPASTRLCLDQLVLHGYAQEGRPDPGKRTKPYLSIKLFTRAIHEQAQANVAPTPTRRSTGERVLRRATASVEIDGAARPPRRRRKAKVTM